MRRLVLRALLAINATWLSAPTIRGAEPTAAATYRSPYSVKFTYPVTELLADFEREARGSAHDEVAVPFRDWYTRHTREHYGAWGPPARHYPAPRIVEGKPIEWRRERGVAVALRFQGFGYQHHHVPDWDPPRGWPWKETAVGHNGKGIDCSNFTAFVYNQAFGLKPNGNVKHRAEELDIHGPGPGRVHRAEHIKLPDSYEERVKALRTGDLLFIRNRHHEISHVVLWVGAIGRAPDDMPLILDSHGEGVKDARGFSIPCGIHLRPFREKSWYWESASHALRILR